MSKEKILSYVATAFEITKMVAIISANTAIKLLYEGKKEIIRQYAEYNEKSYYRQKETLEKLKALAGKASSLKPPAPPSKMNPKRSETPGEKPKKDPPVPKPKKP